MLACSEQKDLDFKIREFESSFPPVLITHGAEDMETAFLKVEHNTKYFL